MRLRRWMSLIALLPPATALGLKLPSFPMHVLEKPAADAFTGAGRCRVAVGPLRFDEGTKWSAKSEAEFVATLKADGRADVQTAKAGAVEAFRQGVEVNHKDYIGKRGKVSPDRDGKAVFLVDPHVVSVDTDEGVVVVYAVTTAQGAPVARFDVTFDTSTLGRIRNLGILLRAAAGGHAMTLLKFFGDRFACEGPPTVVD